MRAREMGLGRGALVLGLGLGVGVRVGVRVALLLLLLLLLMGVRGVGVGVEVEEEEAGITPPPPPILATEAEDVALEEEVEVADEVREGIKEGAYADIPTLVAVGMGEEGTLELGIKVGM